MRESKLTFGVELPNREKLEQIMADFNNTALLSYEKIEQGYTSHNFKILTDQGTFFLKQQKASTVDRLETVEACEIFFKSNNIPVIAPIPAQDNKLHTICDGVTYTLYPFVRGKQYPTTDSPVIIYETMAKLLAKAHLLTRGGVAGAFQEPHNHVIQDKNKTLKEINDLLERINGQEEYDLLAKAGLVRKRELLKASTALMSDFDLGEKHLCFGDYYNDNLFFDGEGNITHVFDLDMAGPMPRLYEVVRSAFLSCCWYKMTPEYIGHMTAFIKAYYTIYPFPKQQLRDTIELFYIKSFDSIWRERYHYVKGDYRTDSNYQDTLDTIEYFHSHREELFEKLCQKIKI